jgi:ketosteroid isomerase-like protein
MASRNVGHPIVHQFFAAMQTGATAEREMMALFAEDAVYVEPFSGSAQTHIGKAAIRAALQRGWSYPLPSMRIEIDAVRLDGETLVADWTCHSPALPNGRGQGVNIFLIRNGLIARLEARIRR